jgi:LmbE family N-acetylglucosaminyl deacetylase
VKALVVCAHPDDEVIAVGGVLRKLTDANAAVRLLTFSAGAEGYTSLAEQDEIVATRAEETRKACRVLGIQEHFNLGLLDWNLSVNNGAYHMVIRHVRQFQPDLVLTHCRADYNDHIAVHDSVVEGWFHAAIPCALSEGDVLCAPALYEFEVLEAIAKPSVIVDITDTYVAKVEAMACYVSQHKVVGDVFQRMEGRALERGGQIGVKYGEALLRNHYRPGAVRIAGELV